jgi:hypothetical protein
MTRISPINERLVKINQDQFKRRNRHG